MQAGYDYLLLRGHLQRRVARNAGLVLLAIGLCMLAAGGAYYGYAANARSGLSDLVVVVPAPPVVTPPAEVKQEPAPRLVPPFSPETISNISLYPGDSISVNSWGNPAGYETAAMREQALLQGFSPVESDDPDLAGPVAPATRIIIPAIGVDSTVRELSIRDLGDSRAYETPNNAVGHIPESVNAGQLGASWFFGHTESPLQGEGSVFYALQQVPERLKNGEVVYIFTDNGSERFLYRATETSVVHQDDIRLSESDGANIHLVSCVPRLVYDHRLIVTGVLVAKQ